MMPATRLQTEIVEYLASRLPPGDRPEVETDLLDTGLLDSMLIMDTVAHLEHEYCVRLDNDHIAPAHFRTPAAIARLVSRLRPASSETL